MKRTNNFMELRALSKRYGNTVALNSINAMVPEGISLMVGENGAGKSTLVSIIEGLTLPSSGNVFIRGLDCISQNLEILKDGTFIPERPPVFGSGKVSEFLYWYSKFKGTTSESIMDMVSLFGVDYLLDSSFASLSMGETEIVQIVAALSTNSDFYVLDEPNSNLDISRRIMLAGTVAEMHRKSGADFLITSHMTDELLPVCHTLISIRRGEIGGIMDLKEIRQIGREEVKAYTSEPDKVLSELEKLAPHGVYISREGHTITIRGRGARYLLRELSDPAFGSLSSVRMFPDLTKTDEKV
ncbi:MAG: ABC transporter ATP-binding protein [Candidatus Thermoplasmatota archaeon]|nr:ABC transporter ATP-binding protein [Candidatus Thermoplasmatota archaeon]MCL5794262.1 ABC transporter ATP-binding protein [Candidatus Thermoplasmatota archaeon]